MYCQSSLHHNSSKYDIRYYTSAYIHKEQSRWLLFFTNSKKLYCYAVYLVPNIYIPIYIYIPIHILGNSYIKQNAEDKKYLNIIYLMMSR